MSNELMTELGQALDARQGLLDGLDNYYNGKQPTAYLSPESKTAVGDRLRTLNVGYCKLAVNSLAERLKPIGFRTGGPGSQADGDLWKLWRESGMGYGANQAVLDALVYGTSFVTVWADEFGRPLATVESPKQMVVKRDPATRQVLAALKVWTDETQVGVGTTTAVLYLSDRVETWRSDSPDVPSQSGGFSLHSVTPNPLGVVPVVPLVNQGRLLDFDGVSEMSDLIDLVDALDKLMSDAMVTSEAYARPRRWATGIEIDEDDDGNPIDPFSKDTHRTWINEDPTGKFGQFQQADLSSYTSLVAMITQQIGAVSGLPPHYLGLNGDQPPSADSIRSSESSLVAKAVARQASFGRPFATVAALIRAVGTGSNFDPVGVETIWANPETRTPTQQTDAAQKLVDMGVPLDVVLADQLGYLPEQIATLNKEEN